MNQIIAATFDIADQRVQCLLRLSGTTLLRMHARCRGRSRWARRVA